MATQFSAVKVVGLLALFCLKSAFYTSLVATALELSPQMLNGGVGIGVGGESNLRKPKEYTPFPLAQDVEVELPLDVDDALNAAAEAEAEEEEKQFLPPWLQLPHNEPPQQQRISSGSAKAFIKMPPTQQQPQLHQQHKQHSHGHTHMHSGSGSGGERRCSIEISSKIPGVCQPMSHIGSACVSGEYMEVFNAECM